jgi:hypothetical protein
MNGRVSGLQVSRSLLTTYCLTCSNLLPPLCALGSIHKLDFLAGILVEHLQDDTVFTFITNIKEAELSRILDNVTAGASKSIANSNNPVKTAALYFWAFKSRSESVHIIQHELITIKNQLDKMISRIMKVVCRADEAAFARTIRSDAKHVFAYGSVLDIVSSLYRLYLVVIRSNFYFCLYIFCQSLPQLNPKALRSQNLNLIAFPKMMRLVDHVWYSDLSLLTLAR